MLTVAIILISEISCFLIFNSNLSAQGVEGNMIYVDKSGGMNYTNIQDAINAANDGETVYVYSGVYYENIVIDKKINLVGDDRNTVIIDGQGFEDVIVLSPSSNWVNLTGFTIQNSGNQYYDSGINVNSDHNTIAGNIIIDCNCGIALNLWGHNCKIYSNSFKNNIYGIIVYSVIPNNNIIYLNNFVDNYINAYDNSNSTWQNLGEGNYWDDYTGVDENGDGIGDVPHNITGGNAQDIYPLMEPNETPGFELLLISLAVLLFILLKKRK